MAWTPEEVEKLKKLIAERLTSGQIEARMPGKSRCAIVGKAHRLGIQIRGGAKKAIREPRWQTAKRAKKARDAAVAKTPARLATPRAPGPAFGNGPPTAPAQPYIAISGPVPAKLYPLADWPPENNLRACKWPFGGNGPRDPILFGCACVRVPGSPYCEEHTRGARQLPKPKTPVLETVAETVPRHPESMTAPEPQRELEPQ